MKARQLCHEFYDEHGAPAIELAVPECLDRIAVGLAGGSQANGNDDEVSRDHAWGPGFAVWLSREDESRFGDRLRHVLESLPRQYQGFRWEMEPSQSCPVLDIDSYITSYVGFSTPPSDLLDWLRIPEAYLFELNPRRIFFDNPGILTDRFRQFRYYPEDVWRKRLSTVLFWVAEWGDKHLCRAWSRGDRFTSSLYRSRYAESVMQVVFLLNRTYAPYHKWLHREFLSLPRLAPAVGRELDVLIDGGAPQPPIEKINSMIVSGLEAAGISPVSDDRPSIYPSVLRDFARGSKAAIVSEEIRSLHTYCDLVFPPKKASWTYALPQAGTPVREIAVDPGSGRQSPITKNV